MCGRFALGIPRKRLRERYQLAVLADAPPRYNIAPGQLVEAVVMTPSGRAMVPFTWGLVPSWSAGTKGCSPLINARAETAADKPAFAAALRHGRCLVPAQGFYEWSKAGGRSQPWFIASGEQDVLSLAAVHDIWQSPAGETIQGLAILTCPADPAMGRIHPRMPVLVRGQDEDRWLAPETDPGNLADILAGRAGPQLRACRVGPLVNSPRNDGPALIQPQDAERLSLLDWGASGP